MIFDGTTIYKLRVEFEDLDAGGVVHHPNYLRFIERARTAAMREQGYSFQQSITDGFLFVVAEMHVKYMKPARYEQDLYVLTRLIAAKRSSVKVLQSIVSELPTPQELQQQGENFLSLPQTLFAAELRLVCVGRDMKPQAVPQRIREAFKINP